MKQIQLQQTDILSLDLNSGISDFRDFINQEKEDSKYLVDHWNYMSLRIEDAMKIFV